MVTIVKHEWHQVDRQYCIEVDESLLAEIYPDLDEDEITLKIQELVDGEIDVEDIVNDAWENNIDLDWDHQYDDCWTDRKGGYEVTYELGDEDSYHHEPEPDPPSHKCTKCKWQGERWSTTTAYIDEQGNVLPDDCDEWHDTKDVCPMCDSDVELTEFGVQEKEAREKRMAEIDAMMDEEEEITDLTDNEVVDLEQALQELKDEFEKLTAHTHKCTECEWQGTEDDCEKEGICPDCCAYIEPMDKDID